MKRATLEFAPELIGMLCKQSEIHLTVKNTLPEDAKLVHTSCDGRTLFLTYESAQFKDLGPGEGLPLLHPVFTKVA